MEKKVFLLAIFAIAASLPTNSHEILGISKLLDPLQSPALLPLIYATEAELSESPCIKKLGSAFSLFLQDPTVGRMLASSGKGFNDLGDYQRCGKESRAEYYVITGVAIGIFRATIGMCLPIECDFKVLHGLKPYIADFFTLLTKMEIKPEQVLMQETKRENKELLEISSGYVIFFLIIGTIFLITVISTVMDISGFFKKKDLSLATKLLACFSAQRNIKGLMNTENRVDQNLEILNGIRVLSISWVVWGHSVLMTLFAPVFNLEDVANDIFHNFTMGFVKAGTLSVDVFFFLSGFLAALAIYRGFKNPKNITIGNILLSYFHRFVRLLPLMLLLLAYTIYIQPTLYDTPISNSAGLLKKQCEDQWYQTLLYYNNFATAFNQTCIPWVWYLQIDMQLYIITPFVIIAYCKSRKLGLLTMGSIFTMSLGIVTFICSYYDFNLSFIRPNLNYDSTDYVYVKPYCRLMPYFIGMMLFVLYNEGKKSDPNTSISIVSNNRIVRISFYLIGTFILYITAYSFYFLDEYPDSWGKAFGIFHMVLCRPLFVIGLSMIIYPVFIGKGRILLAILGHYIFNPLGKLTYGVYMLHLSVLYIVACSSLQGIYYSLFDGFVSTFRTLFLTYLVSFFATILLESPVVQLLKILLEGQRAPPKPKIEHDKLADG